MNGLLRLFLTPRTLTSIPARLTVAAFAATAALVLTVAGGTWAFFGWDTVPDDGGLVPFYQFLAVFATILLVVPAAGLGSAAATLSARRQDERLSTLSLLGAPRRTIVALSVAEPVAFAGTGVLLGIAGYFLLLVPMSLLHFRGRALGYANMVLPVPWILGIAAALVVVAAVSALVGLRRIVVTPLGVRTRSEDRRFPVARIVAAVVLALAALVLLAVSKVATGEIIVLVGGFLAMVFVALLLLNVLGVLVVRGLANRSARRARTAEDLVAARMVSESPKQYWRRVAGLSITVFVAVFGGTGASLAGVAGRAGDAVDPSEALMYQDIYTGVLVTLGISFVFICISALLHQSADIYDRRGTYSELNAAGMGLASIQRINVRAVMAPVLGVTLVSAAIGLFLVFPFAGAALVFTPLTFGVVIVSVVLGIVLIRAGLQVTKPLVASVVHAEAAGDAL